MHAAEQLADIRRQIDGIDDQIVPLLAKRISLALEASRYKHSVDEIRGCDRVQQVLDAVAARVRQADGDVDTIVAIYRFIIEALTELQLREKGLANS
ncbi:chorismate mutase [Burkholderia ubonensis]|uniref:chorismate mutase n=1 Tax=Burkholderia ubonensis subsp. mesacidophila TaxID=265293 RepID=A0A2A4FCQ2_9BURK|nr:chorismate mutase [Burkholderia ubonensis]PCE30206.1 hypothetical protein BZL54_22425 [Burkholderia ubonensis subsp. mesacidophila]